MDTITATLIGALIALVAGLIFRQVEAAQARRQWFRDQPRGAAEQFLADGTMHLKVSLDRTSGRLADASEAISGHVVALTVDISRLQLVASSEVYTKARDALTKLMAAYEAAQKVSYLGAEHEVARQAADEAGIALSLFADYVKHELK